MLVWETHRKVAAGLLFLSLAAAQDIPVLHRPTGAAKIALLGTFHFANPGLDDYKEKHSVDFKSPERQQEIAATLELLARYRPTKIAVEWTATDQSKLDERFKAYLTASDATLGVGEMYQLGFRLAKKLGLNRVYAIDAPGRWYQQPFSSEVQVQNAQQHGQTELIERTKGWSAAYTDWYSAQDARKASHNLIDTLRYLNSPEHLRLDLGRYLVGEIETGGADDYYGADMRTAWYNRNLRIFTNLLRLRATENERILVIIGSGHVPILQHLAANAPEFEVVSVSDLLSKGKP